jgi:hypothetical protein
MAHKTPLASWLYSKREELNPRFKEFSWPKHWNSDVFDFSTTIVWNNFESEGRGIDERREIALEKSVAEAIERLICKSIGIDSVGLAVAGTHDPSAHAMNEALERYFLNQHIHSQIPFQMIEEKFEMAANFEKMNSDSNVTFYRMNTPNHLFGIVCSMVSQRDKKNSLGFALSDSFEIGLRRSMLEALPSYVWLLGDDSEQEEQILPWHIEPAFLQKIEPLLQQVSDASQNTEIELPEVEEVDVAWGEISVLRDAPIQASRFLVLVPGGLG